jgi:hypothetical protein
LDAITSPGVVITTKAECMNAGSIQVSLTNRTQFTHLFARISEEDDGYVVQVRLHNETSSSLNDTAWGEEIADSIEEASKMIDGLAAKFSIPPAHIKLEIRMDSAAENTRH